MPEMAAIKAMKGADVSFIINTAENVVRIKTT